MGDSTYPRPENLSAAELLNKHFKGRTITDIRVFKEISSVQLTLDNGSVLIAEMYGAPGSDNGWCQWLAIKRHGTELVRV